MIALGLEQCNLRAQEKAGSFPNIFTENDWDETIDYSDGIIEARPTVNKELLDYAAEKKLPILKYPGEDFIESYVDFYDKIYPTSED